MNNLYHKIAVASFSLALSLTLGANKEAKAATITLTPTEEFLVADRNSDGRGDYFYGGVSLPVGIREGLTYGSYGEYFREEYRAFYEIDIANLPLNSNTIISSAIFEAKIKSIEQYGSYISRLNVIGYVGNGRAEVSDFTQKELFSDSIRIDSLSPGSNFKFDMTTFIKQMVSNRESFAGIGFSTPDYKSALPSYLTIDSGSSRTLTITTEPVPEPITTEPVPEPTTIFGSALALGVGGWLKRKKSSQQNKTASQR